jgi:hypothetical protein
MKKDNPHRMIRTPKTFVCKKNLTLLQEDPKTDASKMQVEVRNGEVILKGRADTEEEKPMRQLLPHPYPE